MLRLTFCAIALIATATATAYFYLPTPTPTSATLTKPTPKTGDGRERLHWKGEKQPLETFVPLGLLAVGILWLKSVSD